jgi:hypothetical protein
MLANLRRYLRKRPGSAAAGGQPLNPEAGYLVLAGLLAAVLLVVIAILWSAL